MKHSPLEPAHREAGGRMIDFAGWSMPVYYTSIKEEHEAVRSSAGIFDVSHMGEVFVSGEQASQWLETLFTNRVGKLAVGRGQYTIMLNHEGGVIDDLILYRTKENEFFFVINAARLEEDVTWLNKELPHEGALILENKSEMLAAFALQGPKAEEILTKVLPDFKPLKRNEIAPIAGYQSALIARTGYTGEDGFEIFVTKEDGLTLWQSFVAAGAKPCGLGARDTLRLEMGYPLNGSDLSMERTPLEAGLEKFVALHDPLKGEFIGRAVLKQQSALGVTQRLTPLQLCEEGPPLRSHYQIYSGEELLGEISSGAFSPSLGKGIAMAYLPIEFTKLETFLEIDIRGKRYKAVVTTLPFYKKISPSSKV
ncbi:MAG: glycine cleavage system aminomethyltransferase GcvT [Verrucomicrobiae bacterium]|jgi:aminomethyltransferase|nr:glycine cleavage system aminomethyltransferase GcvT [Verrucomicrobiae bacterium]